MRTLIAGCGYVGKELGRRLVAAGDEVWGMARTEEELPEGVQVLFGDLRNRALLDALPPALDRVVFAVAPAQHDEESYRTTYVDGLTNLLDALSCAPKPPTRLVFCSSMSVWGVTDGSVVHEATPTGPARYSGEVMLEAERVALDGPIPAVVARIAGIYGPGRDRVVHQVRSGEARIAPGPSGFTSLIHRDDCAAALHHLLDLADPESLYVVSDQEPVELAERLRYLAGLLGVDEPPVGDDSAVSPWLRQRPGDLGKRLDSGRLRATGFALDHPTYREGYAALVAGDRPA
jgi:nucleoside-diphosphate-sugar epimerase